MGESRREFLSSLARWTVGSAALATMAGCGDVVGQIAESCPTDGAASSGIDWAPDVARPVFYGFTDVDAASGAPGPARIWYPTLDGTPTDARILELCLTRWPLVLFLHGQPPRECAAIPEYYKRWNLMSLARSGYVVVAPELQLDALPSNPASPDLELALRFVDWARSGWEHSAWVSRDVADTALVAHSWGLPVAAQVALRRPARALVSFSGAWEELLPDDVARLTVPSMLMWGAVESGQPSIDFAGRWDRLPSPKYRLAFANAEHFDFVADLPGCDEERGTCPSVDRLAVELSTLFIAKHMPVPLSRAVVHDDMTLGPHELTTDQELYASQHLATLRRLESIGIGECSVDMRWELSASGEQTSRVIG